MAKEGFIRLNTGATLPLIGLGTWQSTGTQAKQTVTLALESGYRHIDTAATYGNEDSIGAAIRESKIPRSQIFVTDKLQCTWHSRAEEALNRSLKALDIGYIDLWLMHWPVPLNSKGNDVKFPKLPDGSPDYEKEWDFCATWKSMEALFKLYPDKIKAIGVSNFSTVNLEILLKQASIIPAANQVELHPSLPQEKLVSYCRSKSIALIAYSPLGSPSSSLLHDPDLQRIAERNGKNVGQCLISWGVQKGWAVVPKSSSATRLRENIETVELCVEDVKEIDEIGRRNPKRYSNPGWHVSNFYVVFLTNLLIFIRAVGLWHDDENQVTC